MAKRRGGSLSKLPSKREFAGVNQLVLSIPGQRPSENLHHDTDRLVLISHGIYIYAKKLNKVKPKIDRKRKKTNSKQLEGCEHEYDVAYSDLKSELKRLNQLLHDDEAGFNTKRCQECGKKESTIWKLEHEAKKFSNIEQTVIDLSSAKNRVSQLQNKLDVLTGQLREETSSKEDARRRISQLQNKLDVLTGQLREETASKEYAIRRLSYLASSKPCDNTPNIADLSDTNRQTKLAEQVSELYDNEWMDAFDELEKSRYSDLKIVDFLLTAFMNVYEECRRITTAGFLEKIQACIEHSDVIPQGNRELGLPDQLRQQAKEFRKSSAAKHIENIIEGIIKQSSFDFLNKQPYNGAKAKTYIRKCIKLSWLMCVQDPPLVLSTEAPRKFSSTLFSEYTSRGPYVAYVVWPIVYLHEGGPVLSKGVAEGSNQDSKEKLTSDRFNKREQAVIHLSRAENKVSTLQNKLDDLTKQLQEETPSKENAIKQVSTLLNKLDDLTKQLQEETTSKEYAIKQVSTLQNKVDDLTKQLQEETSSKQYAIKQVSTLLNKLGDLTKQLQEETTSKEYAIKQVSTLQNKLDGLTKQLQEETTSKEYAIKQVSTLQNKLDGLTKQLQEETTSKEYAIKQLNELGTRNLRENNRTIADLSASNRPTKLAEQLSELYDNEWTDAFNELETRCDSDLEIVECLLTSLMNIFEQCRRITIYGFFEKIQASIEHSDVIPQKINELELPDQLRQQVKDFRKSSAAKNIENIIDGILDQSSLEFHHIQPYNGAKGKPYIRKCIKLSWLMCVQDPPLFLSTDTPRKFSTTLFREYTSRGRYVGYVVWPIVYLHEGGPVLAKGVAQGVNT